MSEKISFDKFSESLRGYNIVRDGHILNRFEVYHALGNDNLLSIMKRQHPLLKLEDKDGWLGGRLLIEKEA